MNLLNLKYLYHKIKKIKQSQIEKHLDMETIEELKKQIEDLQDQVKRQEKLASLGMLTAGIMHEIRNPMNFIMNFSKIPLL